MNRSIIDGEFDTVMYEIFEMRFASFGGTLGYFCAETVRRTILKFFWEILPYYQP